MKELIERLEKATGPDLDLDAAIFEAVTGAKAYYETTPYAFNAVPKMKRMAGLPAYTAYTASIDAARTLVPDDWFGSLQINRNCNSWLRIGNAPMMYSRGATEAITLCIAALKAREGGQ